MSDSDMQFSLSDPDFPPADPEVDRIWRKGRARARRRRGYVMFASTGIVLLAALVGPRLLFTELPTVDSGPTPRRSFDGEWKRIGRDRIETGGYIFSNVAVRLAAQRDPSADRARAVIAGDVAWTEGFPGIKSCSWEIYDANGNLVGSAKGTYMAAEPASGTIKDRVDVTGEPADVEILCAKARLDDPDGQFSFSEVSIEQGLVREPSGRQEMVVSARYSWSGTGIPTPQSCTIVVKDGSGQPLFELQRGLISATGEPGVAEYHFVPPERDREEVEAADLNCRPVG